MTKVSVDLELNWTPNLYEVPKIGLKYWYRVLTGKFLNHKAPFFDCEFVSGIAWFVVIFGINTTSDISKLLYGNSRAVRHVKFETILKYHKRHLCRISHTNHAIICLYWCMTFADCRLQTADCRLHIYRPQIADCHLKDNKNLPNKGDTVKNITSCESEKVAKLASFPRCCWLFFTDATLYWLTQHITNCIDSLFFFDYCELIITSSNAH